MSDRETLAEAIAEELYGAWDDGNAMGLDGWIGPERGETPDDGAIIGRARRVIKADERIAALLAAHDEAIRADQAERIAAVVEAMSLKKQDWLSEVRRDAARTTDTKESNDTGVTLTPESGSDRNLVAYSTTSGIPLERLESFSGEWPMSSVLLDERVQALPPGRYYKLQSQWLPIDDSDTA